MLEIKNPILWLFIGSALVSIVDAAGSILSRRFRFNYGYFIIPSAIVYITISIMVYNDGNYLITFFVLLMVGLYDSTIGWFISESLRANYIAKDLELKEKITLWHRLFAMIIYVNICAWIGIWLTRFI